MIPGTCRLSLDIRAADDAVKEQAMLGVLAQVHAVCKRRGVEYSVEPVMKAAAAPCAPWLADQLGAALRRQGLPVAELPSGAGHDAMKMAENTDIAMLFTHCGNGGISHHSLETMTADDADLSAQVFLDFLRHFQPS